MPRISTLAFAVAAALLAVPQIAAATRDWALPSPATPTVAYEPAKGCPTWAIEVEEDLRARKPQEARYPVCVDQMASLDRALTVAKRDNRLLLVEFGATWCPWCKALETDLASPETMRGATKESTDLTLQFKILKVGLSTIVNGRRSAIPSGEAVLARVLGEAGGVVPRAVPFIVIVDPSAPEKVVARNTDDLHILSEGRIDRTRLRRVLVAAHDHLRHGLPLDDEPGWLSRKLTRFMSRF